MSDSRIWVLIFKVVGVSLAAERPYFQPSAVRVWLKNALRIGWLLTVAIGLLGAGPAPRLPAANRTNIKIMEFFMRIPELKWHSY